MSVTILLIFCCLHSDEGGGCSCDNRNSTPRNHVESQRFELIHEGHQVCCSERRPEQPPRRGCCNLLRRGRQYRGQQNGCGGHPAPLPSSSPPTQGVRHHPLQGGDPPFKSLPQHAPNPPKAHDSQVSSWPEDVFVRKQCTVQFRLRLWALCPSLVPEQHQGEQCGPVWYTWLLIILYLGTFLPIPRWPHPPTQIWGGEEVELWPQAKQDFQVFGSVQS